MSEPLERRIERASAASAGRRRSFPDRTIELIVMPYEQETIVSTGRMIEEIVSRGAFDGIETDGRSR